MLINMLSDYLKREYGKKIYKLLLSSGMTCPNRDGRCGTKGCIFCSSGGSGEFAESEMLSVDEQIECAKRTMPEKARSDAYIAYFQPYSNTYSTAEKIRELYTPVAEREDVAILSIATRPDCIDDEIVEVLSELNKIKPLWIELGLQTIHGKTAEYIRRGYKTDRYTEAVEKLRAKNIKVITHLILGLPFETKDDMIASAKYAGTMSDGIKFHMLYVLKDTDLATDYEDGKFRLLSQDEYIDILCECIRYIPSDVVIHRITGDAEKNSLIAPKWTADKVRLLREINNAFYDKNVTQGEYLNK